MATSPTVRQTGVEVDTAAASATFDVANMSLGNALSGSDLVAFVRTTAQQEANVLRTWEAGGWTTLVTGGVHAAGTGSPILWPLYKRQVSAGPITGLATGASSGTMPVAWAVLEVVGADPADPMDDEFPKSDTALATALSLSLGPMAAPRDLPSLTIVALGFGGGTSVDPGTITYTNGYGSKINAGTNLHVARLAHDGSGPQNTTASWVTAGMFPRGVMVNLVAAEDPPAPGGDLVNWSVGALVQP